MYSRSIWHTLNNTTKMITIPLPIYFLFHTPIPTHRTFCQIIACIFIYTEHALNDSRMRLGIKRFCKPWSSLTQSFEMKIIWSQHKECPHQPSPSHTIFKKNSSCQLNLSTKCSSFDFNVFTLSLRHSYNA